MVARTGLDITLEYVDCLVLLHQENEVLFHKSEYCDRKDLITSGFYTVSYFFIVVDQKFKDQDIQNYNFSCCFVWVWNSVVDIAGEKEAEGVWDHGVEENIWT